MVFKVIARGDEGFISLKKFSEALLQQHMDETFSVTEIKGKNKDVSLKLGKTIHPGRRK